jgi:hypothetical protein
MSSTKHNVNKRHYTPPPKSDLAGTDLNKNICQDPLKYGPQSFARKVIVKI